MKKSYFFKLILLSLTLVSCAQDQSYKEKIKDPELVQANVKNLTDIIVYDIFSPPVASRVYLYPAIAAYQTMQLANEETYASLSGQVKGLEPLTKSTNEKVNAISSNIVTTQPSIALGQLSSSGSLKLLHPSGGVQHLYTRGSCHKSASLPQD